MTEAVELAVGDPVEHRLMPGRVMTVLNVRDCEQDPGQPPHKAYEVTGPDGRNDWLCGLIDAQKPGQSLPWGA